MFDGLKKDIWILEYIMNMKILLKSLRYYFLTCDNPVRREHFMKEFGDLSITEVNPVIGIGRNPSGVSGFSRILDLAVCDQRNSSDGFQPFGIFEDDVKKYREFPESVEIPDDADWFFTGLSYYGMSDYSHCYDVYHKGVDDSVVRMYNMLSVHGIIICSLRGLLAFQKCLMESYFTGTTFDIFTAQIQPYYNCYALRVPLVYQFGEIGGQEEATRVEFHGERPGIPDYWINKTNASILTCHPVCNAAYPL
jgi:hypothetical protein